MRELTKAEEQIMQILWKVKKGFVKDILDHFPEPRPAYNTVSTIIRILESKGFVRHKAYGKTHEYYPAVTKEAYKKTLMRGVMKNYFDSSPAQFLSFFAREQSLSVKDLNDILRLIEQDNEKNKK